KQISFYMTVDNRKIGIQIPNIKSFNRDGGIAAYYALQYLLNAINAGSIHYGLIVVPSPTRGEKFIDLLSQVNFCIKCTYLDEEIAENLILHPMKSSFGREVVRNILSFLTLEKESPTTKPRLKLSQSVHSVPIHGTPYQLRSAAGAVFICQRNIIHAVASTSLSTNLLFNELETQFLESTGRSLASFVPKKTLLNLITKVSR
ncbi:MAG: hypothetical protein ACFFBD_15465, partial [Candidatus Hodarchaeota archaeon]